MAEDVSEIGDKLLSIDGRDVIGDEFMGTDAEWPETDGPISDSPLAVDAVIFADKEFRYAADVAGLPLFAVRRGVIDGFTRVGESSKPSPPSRYLMNTYILFESSS